MTATQPALDDYPDPPADFFGPDADPGVHPDRWPGNDRGTAWPATRDLTIAGLYLALAQLDARRRAAYEDPMSAYAPMDDFAADWDRKERGLLCDVLARGRRIGDQAAVELAKVRLEAWMP